MRHVALALLWAALAGAAAAAPCPDGFVDLGRLSATTAAGRYQEIEVTRELTIGDGIHPAGTYHQKSIQAASDGAASDMRAAQIPAGFHLIPGGRAGGSWWSIENPQLIQIAATENEPAHRVFRIDLYANSGGRAPASASPGQKGTATLPSVWVEVCVLPAESAQDAQPATKASPGLPAGSAARN